VAAAGEGASASPVSELARREAVAIRMRLRRTGKKKQAYYRVVVAESTSPRDGRFIEVVGHYDPNRDPAHIEFDEERALYWLKTGAMPTDTVRSLLSKKGLLARLAEEHPGHAVLTRPMRKKGRDGADARAGAGPAAPEQAESAPAVEGGPAEPGPGEEGAGAATEPAEPAPAVEGGPAEPGSGEESAGAATEPESGEVVEEVAAEATAEAPSEGEETAEEEQAQEEDAAPEEEATSGEDAEKE
jgi:small subunit ribosomal protein S16